MGTEEQSSNGGGVATASDTLTITDNRTGKTYEVPVEDGTVRATALRDIKVNEDDFGVMSYDPAFMNTASCRSADHLPRRRGRGARVPRLSDRAAGRAVDLPRGRLPARPRRAAQPGPARRVDAPDHDPHVRARERQELHAGLPLRRAPDGDAARVDRRALDVLPRRERDPRRGAPLPPHDPADREDADAGGVRLPARDGAAVRLSGQRPALSRQLPEHAVQDDRAQVPAGSRGWSGRWTSSSSCTPITSRTARPTRYARSAPRRSTPTRRSRPASRRSTARCTAAPTRRSCGCCAGSAPRTTSPTSSAA